MTQQNYLNEWRLIQIALPLLKPQKAVGVSQDSLERPTMYLAYGHSMKMNLEYLQALEEKAGIHLRKYEDISESIRSYFETLGRGSAYKTFRTARLKSSDPRKLVNHLERYSERERKPIFCNLKA